MDEPQSFATDVPDLLSTPLNEIDLDQMPAEVQTILEQLAKPRTNLGSSGPGRID